MCVCVCVCVCVYVCVCVCVQGAFQRFDADMSGSVEPHELHTALSTFGYNLSAQAQGAIVRHFSTNGKIGFDSFVACCVRLRVLTSE